VKSERNLEGNSSNLVVSTEATINWDCDRPKTEVEISSLEQELLTLKRLLLIIERKLLAIKRLQQSLIQK
jgi:hypothetical protein